MEKSEWSDRELEELLMQMPTIKDHRDPRDIYQNLSLKKRKKKTWLLPGLAAAAALLLFFILVPKMIDGTNFSYDTAHEEKSSGNNQVMKAADKDSTIAMKDEASSQSKSMSGTSNKMELMDARSTKTAVYEDEVGNGTVLTYWIPDSQAQILVPVSIIVPAEKDKSWLTLFVDNMANLKEEEWGLSDYYPLKLSMKLDEKTNSVDVVVPEDHKYGQGSTEETGFIKTLNNDVSSNSTIKKLNFFTNNEAGIEFGNTGRVKNQDVIDVKKHAFFFHFPEGSELPFLAPSIGTYSDINSAFEDMKTDNPTYWLKSSLEHLQPLSDVTVNGNTLFVSFKDIIDMKDDQLTLASFEALLLTAKQFGLEKVVVKDSRLTHLGPFDLTKETKVPVAPNLRDIQ
ncbi:negative regulator of sigma-X activity [Neobacillus sp. NPDC058068]|uniref:negative regulator of sigma-X activity n=1 Tax=Neobacillus sp. NPDC058068 TaxID=3346325 RepID=UPI0036D956D4